jgi:type I restriction enzyme M protein
MAVWSEVNLSAIELTRCDAEFYRPEYLAARKKAGDRRLKSYGVSVLHPAEFVRKYEDSGLFVLLAQNNRNNSYDWSVKRYASEKLADVLCRNRLEYGDVTITRSGANYGQSSIIGNELEEQDVFACADLLVLRPRGVEGHLVSTFFNTTVGRLLLDRGAYGAAQPHLAPNYIREIPFPESLLDHQAEIKEILNLSRTLSCQSDLAYTQAQQLLESELAQDKLRFDKPVGYTARFSELELSRRFDSEHYYPAFENLKANLPKGVRLVPLGPLLNFCQRGKQPIYSENGLPVLNSKHILENKITLKGNRYAKPNPVPSLQIQHGDVLINGTGRGTIGRTAPYLINEHQTIPDNHVTILRSPTLDPAYLSFYLNSLAGKLQVEKYQRGSSGQLELYPFDIRKFQVWDAPQSIQQEIRRLYEQATESAKQSRELLDQAKSRVEQLIEEAVRT